MKTSLPHSVEVIETLSDHADKLPKEITTGEAKQTLHKSCQQLHHPMPWVLTHWCVSFTSTPWLFKNKQNYHAVFSLALLSSLMTAFSRSLPQTCCTSGDFNDAILLWIILPSVSVHSDSCHCHGTSEGVATNWRGQWRVKGGRKEAYQEWKILSV